MLTDVVTLIAMILYYVVFKHSYLYLDIILALTMFFTFLGRMETIQDRIQEYAV